MRNGATYETSSFLDAQTTSITVAMVAFAPEYGLVSTISITATMSADVQVDFDVKHFQSLEGDVLNEYRVVSIFGFVLAGVILVDKVYTITSSNKDWHEDLPGFLLDIGLQVVLPVVYFSIRLTQVSMSKNAISGTRLRNTSMSFLVTSALRVRARASLSLSLSRARALSLSLYHISKHIELYVCACVCVKRVSGFPFPQ